MKKFRKLFFVFFTIFFIIFLCHLPGYVSEKCWCYNDKMYFVLWNPLNNFFHKFLCFLYPQAVYLIPYWTIIPTIVLNGANMVFGFVNFKKKWWYYLLLAISIFLSFVLFDYYQIRLDPME